MANSRRRAIAPRFETSSEAFSDDEDILNKDHDLNFNEEEAFDADALITISNAQEGPEGV